MGLHCHEIWEYDDERKVQKLVGYKILCERCHLAHHLGFAAVSGRLEETVEWIAKITGMKESEVWKLVDKAFEEWEERSKYTWKNRLPNHFYRIEFLPKRTQKIKVRWTILCECC